MHIWTFWKTFGHRASCTDTVAWRGSLARRSNWTMALSRWMVWPFAEFQIHRRVWQILAVTAFSSKLVSVCIALVSLPASLSTRDFKMQCSGLISSYFVKEPFVSKSRCVIDSWFTFGCLVAVKASFGGVLVASWLGVGWLRLQLPRLWGSQGWSCRWNWKWWTRVR